MQAAMTGMGESYLDLNQVRAMATARKQELAAERQRLRQQAAPQLLMN